MESRGRPEARNEHHLTDLRQRVAAALAAEDWPLARALSEAGLRLAPRDAALRDALHFARWGEWLATRYQAAREHLRAGRWAEAIAHFDAILAQRHSEYFARASGYHDSEILRQQAQEQLDAEPRLADWYERGAAALRAGDAQSAADAFREVVKRRAHYRDAARQLAAALAAVERQRLAAAIRAEKGAP